MRLAPAILLCLSALILTPVGHTQIFQWQDAAGGVHYGDAPPGRAPARAVEIAPGANVVESGIPTGCRSPECRLERLRESAPPPPAAGAATAGEAAYTPEQQRERKYVALGWSEAEVRSRLGKPEQVRGSGRRVRSHATGSRTYVYGPAPEDALTTTEILFVNGRVVDVRRTINRP